MVCLRGEMTKKSKFQTLKNPPAIEAVLDITVGEMANFDVSKLAAKDKAFKKRFPKTDNIQLFEGMFAAGAQGHVSYRNQPLGFSYKSDDEKALCQFRVNGFSYNRLQPYPGWDEFIKVGIENWKIYQALRKKLEIKRIGLRFINMIAIPDLADDLSKHFNLVLSTPSKIGPVKQVKYQYIKHFHDIECIGIVNFAQVDNTAKGGNFILDIDIIKETPANPIAEDSILKYLKDMREAKNTIFFETLTPQTLKAYK
jgi:uncharacterized protein (TIGR04255 family)